MPVKAMSYCLAAAARRSAQTLFHSPVAVRR
jgi:hypothetical protein